MQLLQRQPDGHPLRSHLLAALAAGALPDPRLTQQPPAGCGALWSTFTDLVGARQAGMGGAGLVPPSEVQAWQAGRNVRLSPWELDTLSAMDRATLAIANAAAAPAPTSKDDDE